LRKARGLVCQGDHVDPVQGTDLRIAQCVAFNWHNDFFELDLEPEVAPRELAADPSASRA
jgi:hypothetical protein